MVKCDTNDRCRTFQSESTTWDAQKPEAEAGKQEVHGGHGSQTTKQAAKTSATKSSNTASRK